MAERLPRYRRTGVSPTAVPSVSTRGLNYRMPQMQISDPFAGITSALDKMTDFAFERAVGKAKKEGVEFRMENPITSDQISAAMSQGRDIDEIVGDPDTIFGSASRATASAQLKTELEANARNEIAAISAALNSDVPINPDEVQVKIQSVIDGHADILAQVDPGASYSYRGTISTIAAPVYKLALEKEYKRARLAGQLSLNNAMAQAPAAMLAAVMASAGAVTEVNGKPVPELEQSFAVIRRTLMDQAIGTGDLALIKNTQEKILKMEEKAKVDGLRQFARENPSIVDVYSGNYGRLTSVYAGLSEDNKETVREKIINERAAENKAAKERRTELEAQTASAADRVLNTLYGMNRSDPAYPELKAQYERYKKQGLYKPSEHKALDDNINAKPKGSDDDFLLVVQNINSNKYRNLSGIRNAMGELDLDPGQRVKLEDRFKTQLNTDKREAYRILRKSVGALSELTRLDLKTQVMLADMEQQLQEKYDKGIAQEKPQTYVEIANELYRSGSGDLKRKELEKSEDNIKSLLKGYGINVGNITKENIESLISDLEGKKAESYDIEALELHKRKYLSLEQ